MSAPFPQTVLVTGANVGLGLETCRQLAMRPDVQKVILACRNAEKAKKAVEQLVKLTSKPESTFDVVMLDTNDLATCRKAAETMPVNLDGMIMNAGGLFFGSGGNMTKDGVVMIMQANVIGHAVFLEALIAAGKLNKGARILYAGSEAARGITNMGFAVPKYDAVTADAIVPHIDGKAPYFSKKFDPIKSYPYVKNVAALYMMVMARKHPEYYFITVSPGNTAGTEVTNEAPKAMQIVMDLFAGKIMDWMGMRHRIDVGAARYITGLTGELQPSGAFYASAAKKMSGALVDQSELKDGAMFKNTALQDAAYEAVHRFTG